MRCPIETQESVDVLLAYASGKLDDARSEALELHLRECAACREFAEGQKAVWQALDRFEAPPVSADFDRALYQRIDREVSWWDLMLRPFRPRRGRQREIQREWRPRGIQHFRGGWNRCFE